jgi:stress response protein SCP2
MFHFSYIIPYVRQGLRQEGEKTCPLPFILLNAQKERMRNMAISLTKGQSVDLVKKDSTNRKVIVGLGWKSGKSSSGGGLLGALFGGSDSGHSIDVDSAILVLDVNGRPIGKVYYGNKDYPGIHHNGDDTTGNNHYGVDDNEEIHIDLSRLPKEADKLVIIANIFSGAANFGNIRDAYVRVLDENRKEMARYNLSDDYKGMKGVITAQMYLRNGDWKFKALGQGTKQGSLDSIIRLITQ